MRARPLLLALGAVCIADFAIACADARTPTAPTPDAANPSLGVVANANCTRNKTYYLAETTYDEARTVVVNGAVGPRKSSDAALMAYALPVTGAIENEVALAVGAGCPVEVLFTTFGLTATLNAARAEYGGVVQVKSSRAGMSDIIAASIRETWSQAPNPPGCLGISCLTQTDHVVPLSASIQAGDVVAVQAAGHAFARAIGTSTGDQAAAGWYIPNGGGRHPYGPRLRIQLP